jgi:hypothetical protein
VKGKRRLHPQAACAGVVTPLSPGHSAAMILLIQAPLMFVLLTRFLVHAGVPQALAMALAHAFGTAAPCAAPASA